MEIIENNKSKIIELCEKYNVKNLYAFGSVVKDRLVDESDIDVLVQFNEIDLESYFDNYMDLKEQLEELFNRRVDLVENQAIRNPIFRKVVDREKQLIYERNH